MSKHTPGPWTLVVNEHGSPIKEVIAADGRGICEVYEGDAPDPVWANARLIAAAPELLTIVARELSNGEQSHFEDWLERTCPSGDVEAVKRQWLGSADYAVFADEYREELAVLDKIEGRH